MVLVRSCAIYACIRGKFQGSEEARLHILRQAAALGADHVDVELKAAAEFFAGRYTSGAGSEVRCADAGMHLFRADGEV